MRRPAVHRRVIHIHTHTKRHTCVCAYIQVTHTHTNTHINTPVAVVALSNLGFPTTVVAPAWALLHGASPTAHTAGYNY